MRARDPIAVRRLLLTVLGCVSWFVLTVSAAQSMPPALPDTPAGRRFGQWLEAFDSGSLARYGAFVREHAPAIEKYIRDDFAFSLLTGGFRVLALGSATDTSVSGVLAEPFHDVRTRFEIRVEPKPPHRILALDLGPAERPDSLSVRPLAPPAFIDALGDRLRAQTEAGLFSGVVLVARRGGVVFERAYGHRDARSLHANTIATRFGSASMGKMFTAVAIMQLVEAGKLDLHAPLGRYLPDYPETTIARHVTLHQLLTHTAGTGDIFVPEVEAQRATIKDCADYVRVLGTRPPDFAPGARYEYSNYGFVLLGCVIERVSGMSYWDYLARHVYEPAGMRHAGRHGAGAPEAEGRTRGDSTGWAGVGSSMPDDPSPAGGERVTARDLYAFVRALEKGRLLSRAGVDTLTRAKVTMRGGAYAYGFKVQERAGRRYVGHGGGAPGTNAELDWYRESGDVVIVLTNLDPPFANRVADFIGPRLPLSP